MPYRVLVIESERGWGSKIDSVIYFETEEEAWAFERSYNKDNPPGPAPDWYMQAEDPTYVPVLPPGEVYAKRRFK